MTGKTGMSGQGDTNSMDGMDGMGGRRIFVVGLGSLGSTLCTEIAKRGLALKQPLQLALVDFDTVEERNVVAQDFRQEDVGALKVEAVGEYLKGYSHLCAERRPVRVTQENVRDVLPASQARGDLLVDAVDNYPTRHLLWLHAQMFGVPLLHLSMSKKFGGHAQWTYSPAGVDTWSLSPAHISPSAMEDLLHPEDAREEDDPALPPCVLNSKRSLIWNTAMAGVNALFIALGHDSQEVFTEALEGDSCQGLLSTWTTDLYGYQPCFDQTEIVNYPHYK